MNTLELKIFFIGIIFLCSSTCGLSPVLFGKVLGKRMPIKDSTKKKALSCASCFGAGVFLYVCFMGLLPDADKKFHIILDELAESGPHWESFADFPWPYFIVVCGFIFIFTIDKVVHAIEHVKANRRYMSSQPSVTMAPGKSEVTLLEMNGAVATKTGSSEVISATPIPVENTPEDPHGHGVPSSLILLIALCMHAIFEGMAVGLQTTSEKVVTFSVAIIIHESVMALTFGITVSKGDIAKCKKIVYVLVFASSIPSGIAIGLLMQNADTNVSYIVSAVFSAFAPGIFLHVIFIEILSAEFGEDHSHTDSLDKKKLSFLSEVCIILLKIFFIMAGFTLILVVTMFTPHPE